MKLVFAIVTNLAVAAVFIHGVCTNNPITANLAKFYSGFLVFATLGFLIVEEKIETKYPIPRWLDGLLHCAMIVAAAANGWFWCAASVLLVTLARESYRDRMKKLEAQPKPATN